MIDGITRLPTTKRDNAFLVEEEDGYTLVDVGWAGAPKAIEAFLAERNRSLRDIRRIVITHAHPDHVKGLHELRVRTGATVLIHSADAPWLQNGRVPAEGRSGGLGRFIDRLPLAHWTPVTANGHVADGDMIGNLRVLHTPGHTPGHIALLHEPSRALLVGDLIFNRGTLGLGPPALAADPGRRPDSIAKLPKDVSAIGLAHGDPLVGRQVELIATIG
ncbi:MBL fold metallo-hydrolase [Kutzneria buriramensis]|uniref:Glyoxylase-like metal-dependent hydrolase (Beta-lactamase superfamily II) n=1 Tax=Kutzneria buriramensis TaxID=1045776 RepID=A0A3E0I6P2_9PSEU|nr:MBL fold metallo-hydrolase [Kutzneria buriramensis]REH54281.1 glyoxylase-like metal-dependent hydrolase (beta-lactamase superfamily II) [Kutzneria buriramensis]